MTHFDLSILETLKIKFEEIENSIIEYKKNIEGKERQKNELQIQIQSIESEKMNIELDIGNLKSELLKKEELYSSTKDQYNILKQSADQLLNLLNE